MKATGHLLASITFCWGVWFLGGPSEALRKFATVSMLCLLRVDLGGFPSVWPCLR